MWHVRIEKPGNSVVLMEFVRRIERHPIKIRQLVGTLAVQRITGNLAEMISAQCQNANVEMNLEKRSWVATSSSIIPAVIGVFLPFGPDKSHVRVQYVGHNHPFPPPQPTGTHGLCCVTAFPVFQRIKYKNDIIR